MPLPDGVKTITVTGTYTDFEGEPCAGLVTITLGCSCYLVADDGTVIVGGKTIRLDATGSFTTEIVASRQDAITPYDFCYQVTEETTCLGCPRSYTIAAPLCEDDGGDADVPCTLDLSDVLNTA